MSSQSCSYKVTPRFVNTLQVYVILSAFYTDKYIRTCYKNTCIQYSYYSLLIVNIKCKTSIIDLKLKLNKYLCSKGV